MAPQQLRAVGVDLRIERVEPGVFGARRREKRFDALSRVWNPVYDPDQTFLNAPPAAGCSASSGTVPLTNGPRDARIIGR